MTTTPLPPLSRDDQRLLLWQAIQRASKVGNATDDKLIVEELHRAGLCIAKDTNVEKTPWWEIADMPPPPTSEQARADLEAENKRLREALQEAAVHIAARWGDSDPHAIKAFDVLENKHD